MGKERYFNNSRRQQWTGRKHNKHKQKEGYIRVKIVRGNERASSFIFNWPAESSFTTLYGRRGGFFSNTR
jgi:hypothetical protein